MGHGSWVLRTLSEFAPDATYYLYRIETNEMALRRGSETIPESRLIDALAEADEDDLDLLNISGGVYHHKCDRDCEISTVLDQDVESDVLTVAAAGNRKRRSEKKHSLCPALSRRALAVGGYVSRCDHEYVDNPESDQIWASLTDVAQVDQIGPQTPLCGYGRCEAGHGCSNDRSDTWFPLSVLPAGGKPDVLAPVHYPRVLDDRSYLMPGTSYAAPVVTGLLAGVLGSLDRAPSAERVRGAVLDAAQTSAELNVRSFETEQAKFDAERTRARLANPSRVR